MLDGAPHLSNKTLLSWQPLWSTSAPSRANPRSSSWATPRAVKTAWNTPLDPALKLVRLSMASSSKPPSLTLKLRAPWSTKRSSTSPLPRQRTTLTRANPTTSCPLNSQDPSSPVPSLPTDGFLCCHQMAVSCSSLLRLVAGPDFNVQMETTTTSALVRGTLIRWMACH